MFLILILLSSMLVQRPSHIPLDEPEKCKVLNTRSPDQYEFVRIHDLSTGLIVFQSTIRGGDSKGVFTKGDKIRIEHKWAGDRDYHSGVVVECKNGNTIRI
jgi:hypothetical protein